MVGGGGGVKFKNSKILRRTFGGVNRFWQKTARF